ncbi:MAG: (2Fe-2S)-binding protein, partial [Polyangiaceae bacterium]|nr:(2Fe-2S)-binding protein [Polyangiaceae bacterium]
DRTIRDAIGSGARCRGSVGRACGAGTGCGGCLPTVDAILQSEGREHSGLRLLSAEDLASVG